MMNKFKFGVFALAIIIGTNLAASKKAEAGVILVAVSGGSAALVIAGGGLAAVGAYTAVFTAIAPDEAWFYPEFAIPGGIAGFVLGKQDSSQAEKHIAINQLQIRYPGIGKNALAEIVDYVYEKAGITELSKLTENKSVIFEKSSLENEILKNIPESKVKSQLIRDLTN